MTKNILLQIFTFLPILLFADGQTVPVTAVIIPVIVFLLVSIPVCIASAFVFNLVIERLDCEKPVHKKFQVVLALIFCATYTIIEEETSFLSYFDSSPLSSIIPWLAVSCSIFIGLIVGYKLTPKVKADEKRNS